VVSLAQRRRLRRVSRTLFYKIDRIHYFDIRYSLFQSFSYHLAGISAFSGGTDTCVPCVPSVAFMAKGRTSGIRSIDLIKNVVAGFIPA
jgi:hypothetical protein